MADRNKKQKASFLEGSNAIARTIALIKPEVVSAYPITPQTHIVEDLAKFKADGKASFSYIRAESEFAAASIIAGASAAGSRVYSATSSQGVLLMLEVLYNISGMRLPAVMTIANRAVGAPINIWNDHSDAMAIRDAGWIMLFAENHQEAVDLHIIAYKIAESLNLPVAINVDGFILTHAYESVYLPNKSTLNKFLPKYKPAAGTYLNPKKPVSLGSFYTPEHYWKERERLDKDLKASAKDISHAWKLWQSIFPTPKATNTSFDNGLVEYSGPKNAETILVVMGSLAGTIKEVIKKEKNIGLLKIRSFRPFPSQDIKKILLKSKNIAVLEKAFSSGSYGPLYSDLNAALTGYQGIMSNHIVGLGGKEISTQDIKQIIKTAPKAQIKFH